MMRRTLVLTAALALVAGCSTYQPLRDTTQPGKIKKSALTDGSEWYMLTTVIEAPYEAAFTFPGEASELYKVKWVVEKNYLYAYKTYELIKGTEFADAQEEYLGEPVAAYRIEAHLDVWKQYNPVTGEEMPVVYESQERPWWEREWIRVDWSTNLVKGWNYMMESLCKWSGDVVSDPVAYYPTKEGDPEQFYVSVRGKTDADFGEVTPTGDSFCEQVGDWCNVRGWKNIEQLDSFDYMDVINREFVHYNTQAAFTGVDIGCWPYPVWPLEGGLQVTQRVSFMKVPKSDYEPLYYPDPTWEKFGYFRTERDTFDPVRGITDLHVYYANRWNIWQRNVDDNGNEIPAGQREIKPITYYYIPTDRLPSHQACASNGIGRGQDGACVDYIHDDLYSTLEDQWSEAYRSVLKAVKHPEADTAKVFQVKPIDYSCGPNGDAACEQIGDLRFNFMWNHDLVGAATPLGYGPSFSDPETGELIAANANFYGGALRTYAGRIGDYYDLIKGNLSELEITTGENIREYFQNEGSAIYPPGLPIVDLDAMESAKMRAERGDFDTTQVENLPFKLVQLKHDLDQLKRMNPRDADRRERLRGSPIEREMITPELLAFMGEDPNAPLTDELLDRVSPFRSNSQFSRMRNRNSAFWSKRNVLWGDDMWSDLTIGSAIDRAEQELGANATKDDVVDYLLRAMFVGVEAHELGHTMGLMHNFEGSFDEENYHPEYWQIMKDLPTVEIGDIASDGTVNSDWDTDGDHKISAEEYQAYHEAYVARRQEQKAAGSDLWSTAAIMDYNGTTLISSEIGGVGRYEHAALKYAYANTVEVYSDDQSKFDAAEIQAAGGWDAFKFEKRNRVDIPYYAGGERCNDTSECPAADNPYVRQRCRAELGTGAELHGGSPTDLGVCSSLWKEFELNNVAHPKFQYCSDYRRDDKPFCNVWDEGKSAQEIVDNLTAQYEKDYIFNAFRRYRVSFPFNYESRIWSRYFMPIGKIYQSLLYNYYYQPGYSENLGRGGMLDSFLASRNGMNFFVRVLSTPDIGSYIKFDPNDTFYDGSYTESKASWADVYIPMGVGKHLWSAMEQGELGAIWRFARIGTFYDKWLALEALSTRDWGMPEANDETYPINFYDAFPDEMLELFSSIVSEQMQNYAPVIREVAADGKTVTKLEYRDIWKGGFFKTPTSDFYGLESVKGWATDQSERYQGEVLDAGGSTYIREYALMYSLLDFPVFYDFNFPAYVQLYQYGKPSAKDVDAITSDPNVVAYESVDRDTLYATVKTANGTPYFEAIIEKGNTEQQHLLELRSIKESGTIPADFMDRSDAQICRKVLASSATTDECLDYLIERQESEVENVESFLRLSHDLLNWIGFQTQ